MSPSHSEHISEHSATLIPSSTSKGDIFELSYFSLDTALILNIPVLPFEVISIVGEHLSIVGHYGTLAGLNRTCKHVRQETLPILWKKVVVKRFETVGTTSGSSLYTPEEYLEEFKVRYGGEEHYKYIKQILDEECILGEDGFQRQLLAPNLNPFQDATIIGACTKPPAGSRSSSAMSCSVRLGAKKQRCNDDLSDTLHAQLKARPPSLFESLEGLSNIKVNLAIPERLKTAEIEPLSIQCIKDLLNVSSIGWFPRGRINEVHVDSEVKWRNFSTTFDAGSLQTMTLDMITLLAVSAGKHVLLGANSECTRPSLCFYGLTFEEVKVVLDLWFNVIEHAPIYAAIKIVLSLRQRTPTVVNDIAAQLRRYKSSYLRHRKVQGDCADLEIKLVNSGKRPIAILGRPLQPLPNGAAGLCLYNPNERRVQDQTTCVLFEQWSRNNKTKSRIRW